MKFLLEESTAASANATQWILPAVLLVLVIGIFILNYFRSKKTRENMQDMVNSIKVGDKVKTYSGFYGKIIEITETTDGKVAVLETGNEGHFGYLSIDMNAIYAIDSKQPVVLDADGNIIDPNAKVEEKAEKVVEEKAEKVVEEKAEPVVEEKNEVKEEKAEVKEVKAEKSKAKKTTKKSAKKDNE